MYDNKLYKGYKIPGPYMKDDLLNPESTIRFMVECDSCSNRQIIELPRRFGFNKNDKFKCGSCSPGIMKVRFKL